MAKFPTLTTLFIILGFIGVFIAGILGAKLGKHYQASNSKSDTSKILLIIEIILITIEVFKQIFITINEKAYQWDLFPFQICSMIVYVIPLIQLVKSEKPFYPVLKTIFKTQLPYPIYFICFLIYFISGACVIYGICRFVYAIIDKKVHFKNMVETKA